MQSRAMFAWSSEAFRRAVAASVQSLQAERTTSGTGPMSTARTGRSLSLAYAATVFLGAFLLFQVQPLFGKAILPWFGGTPAVWTTCMLVFQVLLFGGYAYAHVTGRYLSPRQQVFLHLALLTLAACLLPIAPSAAWKPKGSEWPV